MVGKSNLPLDVDSRPDLPGSSRMGALRSASISELSALDQEREASMADEGGASGAYMEHQEFVVFTPSPNTHKPFKFNRWILGGSAVLLGSLAGLAYSRYIFGKARLKPPVTGTSSEAGSVAEIGGSEYRSPEYSFQSSPF